MNHQPSTVERTLNQRQLTFTLPEKPALANLCDLAREFDAACAPLLEQAQQDKRDVTMNVLLLQLQYKFFENYKSAPLAHRKHGGRRRKGFHTCLFDVYFHHYELLNRFRLELNPPLLREPAPAKPVPQFQGIFLGEEAGV